MAWLDDFKKANPWATNYSDDYLVGYISDKMGADPRQFASQIGYALPTQNKGALGDTLTAVKRGALELPSAITGLLDVPVAAVTGRPMVSQGWGEIGKLTGFKPSEWADNAARFEYSPGQQQAQQDIQQVWQDPNTNAVDVVGAYARKPGYVFNAALESVPSMIGGAGIGRAALKAGQGALTRVLPNAAPYVAAGIGEGAITAGQQMAQTPDTVDGRKAALSALAAGAGTGAIGFGAGRLANRLGLGDIETALVGGGTRAPSKLGLPGRVAGGFASEGLLEELPQSMQEQMWQNYATDRPLMEGVARQGVEGALAGGLIGGGFNALPQRAPITPSTSQPTDLLQDQNQFADYRQNFLSQVEAAPMEEAPAGMSPVEAYTFANAADNRYNQTRDLLGDPLYYPVNVEQAPVAEAPIQNRRQMGLDLEPQAASVYYGSAETPALFEQLPITDAVRPVENTTAREVTPLDELAGIKSNKGIREFADRALEQGWVTENQHMTFTNEADTNRKFNLAAKRDFLTTVITENQNGTQTAPVRGQEGTQAAGFPQGADAAREEGILQGAPEGGRVQDGRQGLQEVIAPETLNANQTTEAPVPVVQEEAQPQPGVSAEVLTGEPINATQPAQVAPQAQEANVQTAGVEQAAAPAKRGPKVGKIKNEEVARSMEDIRSGKLDDKAVQRHINVLYEMAQDGRGSEKAAATKALEQLTEEKYGDYIEDAKAEYERIKQANAEIAGMEAADVEEGSARFSKSEGQAGMSVKSVQDIVDRWASKWQGLPPVWVVDLNDPNLTPKQKAQLKAVFADTSKGVYMQADGKPAIIMVSNNLTSPADVTATLFHEALGHYGLSVRFKSRLDEILNGIYRTNEGVRKAADAYLKKYPDAYTGKDQFARATEEVLAYSAQQGTLDQGIISRLIAFIRQIARQMGLRNLAFTNDEVLAIIRQGQEAAKVGGTVSGEAQGARFSMTDKIVEAVPSKMQEPIRYAADVAGEYARKGAQFLSFTNELVDAVEEHLPSARTLIDAIDKKMVEMTRREKQVGDIAEAFAKINPAAFNKAWTLGRDMRIKGLWGYQPTWLGREVEIDSEMATRWNELEKSNPEAAQLLDQAFKYGAETYKDLQKILDDIATESHPGDSEEAQKARDLMKRKLPAVEGPYLPLRRVGSHLFFGKSQAYLDAEANNDTKAMSEMQQDENHYIFKMFDSLAEAKSYQRANGPKYAKSVAKAKEQFFGSADALPFAAFERIKEMAGAVDADAAKEVIKLANELYLTVLADTSARKSELRAKGVAGMDAEDMFRAFVSKGRANAHYIAALKDGRQVSKAYNDMRNEAIKSEDAKASEAYNELAARYAKTFQVDHSPVIDKVMGLTSMWMLLTKPAYYLYNATQPALLTQPYLAQTHGAGNSYNAMVDAYKQYFSLKNILKPGVISFDGLSDPLKKMLGELTNRGKIDITIAQELGDLSNMGKGTLGKAISWANLNMRGLVQKAEMMNRVVSAIAAYNLAIKANLSEAAATDYAAKVIDKTQGNYTNFNAPRAFNANSLTRMLTQFRKFQILQMTYFINSVKEIAKGRTLEEKWALSKMLRYTLMHHAVLAGGMGLPLMNVVAFLFSQMGDDEPEGLELTLRNAIGDETAAQLLLRGVPAAVFNTDISKNVGASGAFQMTGGDFDLTSREGFEKTVFGLLGPAVGLGAQAADAIDTIGKGDYYKGLEKLMPGVVRTSMQAVREATEGQTNKRGDVLVTPEEINLWSTGMKALGFRTADDVLRSMVRQNKYEFEQYYDSRQQQIKRDYIKAYRSGDSEAMSEALQSWTELAESMRNYGFKPVNRASLIKAPQEQTKRERSTANGVQFNKNNAGFVKTLTE